MNRIVVLCVVLAALVLPVSAASYLDVIEMKVRVFATPAQVEAIAPDVLEFYGAGPGWFVGAVTEPIYKNLVGQGYQVDVLVPDVRARAMENDAFFHTYAQLRDTWAIVAQNHPNICVLDTMGTSANGNLLLVMKISDNPTLMEGEPRICFDFSMHGNENNGCEIAHWSLLQLVNGYGSDPQITYMVNNREIWLCPMDNPDGLISRSRYNGHGVDCNRNYGYSWDGGGPSVFSEPEVNCFYHLAEENPMAAWSQYHSGAESAMWPWFYTSKATMDSIIHALEMTRYGQICNYPAYQISRGLYPGNGGSTDWYYGARGALGYAYEVCDGQPSGVGEIDTVNHKNWTAMKEQIMRATWGIMGHVTDSASGLPVYARMVVNPPDWFTYTDSTGYYHKNLRSGTYSVTAFANGYRSKTVANVTVPADTYVITNLQLARDTAATTSAFKVLTSYLNETPSNSNPTFASHALGQADGRRFSIGNDGYCSFDMGKTTPIINGAGNDFTVVEGDADPEACTVYVSNDWNGPWHYVGFGTSTQGCDLSVAGLSTARFVRVVDDNSGGSGGNAGYDLDAIEATVVNAPALVYQSKTVLDSPPGGNNDGKLDAGENADLTVTLKNAGRVGVSGVTAVLRTQDAFVSVLDSAGAFGSVPPDSVRTNNADKFRVAAAVNTPKEHVAQMKVFLTGTDYADSFGFTITVGELRAVDPIPDGPRTPPLYWAYDNVDTTYSEHPTYQWVELRGLGTRLTMGDDETRVVSLPSSFGPWRYYGQNFTQVSICSNGWIAPGSTSSTAYQNTTLPDATQPPQLALFWDDLYPPAGGGIWYYHDTANHRFTVEYDSVRYFSGTLYDKNEIIIYDTTMHTPTGDNVIVMQFYSANGYTSTTMGIEDPTCAIGINCLADGGYNRGCASLAAGRAVKYTTKDPTGISEPAAETGVPRQLALGVSGNPMRNRAMLSYTVPAAGRVTLGVYDGCGRLVRQLATGMHRAGAHRAVWNGTDMNGRSVAAGVYWLRLSDESGSTTAKAVVLR